MITKHRVSAGKPVAISFATGDDLDQYLVSNDPDAIDWTVVVRKADGSELVAPRAPDGYAISQFKRLGPNESAWFVGSILARIHEIIVREGSTGNVRAVITFDDDTHAE